MFIPGWSIFTKVHFHIGVFHFRSLSVVRKTFDFKSHWCTINKRCYFDYQILFALLKWRPNLFSKLDELSMSDRGCVNIMFQWNLTLRSSWVNLAASGGSLLWSAARGVNFTCQLRKSRTDMALSKSTADDPIKCKTCGHFVLFFCNLSFLRKWIKIG